VTGAATQIYYRGFNIAFFKLPSEIRARIEAKIDDIGLRLTDFPHYRLTGSNRCRLRVGDYRIIYACDVGQNAIHVLAVGHRREIYREVQDHRWRMAGFVLTPKRGNCRRNSTVSASGRLCCRFSSHWLRHAS